VEIEPQWNGMLFLELPCAETIRATLAASAAVG
jgi:hypothetical protein